MNLLVNEESQELVAQRVQNAPNGVHVVVNAMKAHTNDSSIQEWCITVLCKLSTNPRACMVVGEAGGVGALVEAVRAHFNKEQLADKGTFTLATLTGLVENQVGILPPSCVTSYPKAEAGCCKSSCLSFITSWVVL